MCVFFAFSDESGNYKLQRSKKFLDSTPFYIRATFIVRASEWKALNMRFRDTRQAFGMPLEKEIKWSHIWNLRAYQEAGRNIPSSKPFHFLSGMNYDLVVDFVDSSLEILADLSYVRTIITITVNDICRKVNEDDILKWHLQETMQRIEMELQDREESLCVLFIDPLSRRRNELFRNIYSDLYQNGDFVECYSHIKDSLNIEYSHHSVGIQLADYVAGSFCGFLREYPRSEGIFTSRVKPHLRSRENDEILGYGVREVPKDNRTRSYLARRLSE